MSLLREEIKQAFAHLGEKEFALLDCIRNLEEKATNWDLVEKLPEKYHLTQDYKGVISRTGITVFQTIWTVFERMEEGYMRFVADGTTPEAALTQALCQNDTPNDTQKDGGK